MEKADNLQVMPFSDGWSDLGDWEALRRITDKDGQGTALVGAATSVDCSDSLLWSASEGQELVGIGLENIIAVAMPDAVLVADRSPRAGRQSRCHGACRRKARNKRINSPAITVLGAGLIHWP